MDETFSSQISSLLSKMHQTHVEVEKLNQAFEKQRNNLAASQMEKASIVDQLKENIAMQTEAYKKAQDELFVVENKISQLNSQIEAQIEAKTYELNKSKQFMVSSSDNHSQGRFLCLIDQIEEQLRCSSCFKPCSESNPHLFVCDQNHLECSKCAYTGEYCVKCSSTKEPRKTDKTAYLHREKTILNDILAEIKGNFLRRGSS